MTPFFDNGDLGNVGVCILRSFNEDCFLAIVGSHLPLFAIDGLKLFKKLA